jgi:hypothetical protein
MKILCGVLFAVCVALTYNTLVMHKELQWAKYNLYQEEATTYQLMMNGICRMPDDGGWPEFCKASNGSRKEYLEWYSKFTKQPIPEFPL